MKTFRKFSGKAVRLAALFLPALVRAATPVSPPVVEYTIETSLDPTQKTLDGTERLIWRNPSSDAVPAIALLILLQFGVLWLRSAVRVAAWGSYIAFLEPRARPALSAIARVKMTFEPAPATSA
jgi:hypothetical protein